MIDALGAVAADSLAGHLAAYPEEGAAIGVREGTIASANEAAFHDELLAAGPVPAAIVGGLLPS